MYKRILIEIYNKSLTFVFLISRIDFSKIIYEYINILYIHKLDIASCELKIF